MICKYIDSILKYFTNDRDTKNQKFQLQFGFWKHLWFHERLWIQAVSEFTFPATLTDFYSPR